MLSVVPKTGPDAAATSMLVHRMRDDDLPLVARAGGTGYVAGNTAADIDVSARLGSALPVFIAIIVILAFLLLMIAFRSLLVPLTAVIGFLLSVAASLGVVVWVFQYGHLGRLVGTAAAVPIVSFVPVLLVGVLFGLAMDYEVFLISRMRERFERDGDPGAAVAAGLQRSGRVVCAAALIMTAVFAGFIPADDPIVKSIAFALTAGVLHRRVRRPAHHHPGRHDPARRGRLGAARPPGPDTAARRHRRGSAAVSRHAGES